jgi:hypothetical protein
MTARRRHTGDGASARNGDSTGVVEGRRRRVGRYGVLSRFMLDMVDEGLITKDFACNILRPSEHHIPIISSGEDCNKRLRVATKDLKIKLADAELVKDDVIVFFP